MKSLITIFVLSCYFINFIYGDKLVGDKQGQLKWMWLGGMTNDSAVLNVRISIADSTSDSVEVQMIYGLYTGNTTWDPS